MINHCPLLLYPYALLGTASDRERSARWWVVLVRSERPRWYLASRRPYAADTRAWIVAWITLGWSRLEAATLVILFIVYRGARPIEGVR